MSKDKLSARDKKDVVIKILYENGLNPMDYIDLIKDIESFAKDQLESESKWISVEDRLPEDDRWYLCWIHPFGEAPVVGRLSDESKWQIEDDDGDLEDCIDITHWQPLPKPPK